MTIKDSVALFFLIIICLPLRVYSAGPTNLEEFLSIVEERAPDIQIQKGEVVVSEKAIERASQFLNPDISIGAWRGKANSVDWQQTDISVLQPIEFGGKRTARIQLAEAQSNLAKNDLKSVRSNIRLITLLKLHRLRQLIFERSLLEEAQITFEKLIKSYKSRPQLSPEQSTSLFLFQMAKRDYDLKKTEIDIEEQTTSIDLKKISGIELNEIIPILPKKISKWPDVQSSNKIMSPKLDILKAKIEVLKSDLEISKSESWPTTSIGPSYTNQNQFGEQAKIWGVVLTTKLPLLSTNQGGRAASRENLYLSEKVFLLEEASLFLKKKNLMDNYKNQILTLKKSNVDDAIHKKHEQIESYFLRGLINSSLVIETHRQIFDSQKSYHGLELSALENYYQIRIFDGTFFEGEIF